MCAPNIKNPAKTNKQTHKGWLCSTNRPFFFVLLWKNFPLTKYGYSHGNMKGLPQINCSLFCSENVVVFRYILNNLAGGVHMAPFEYNKIGILIALMANLIILIHIIELHCYTFQ